MHDIGEFLQRHPPFESLDEDVLKRVACAAEIEFYAAGTAILESAEVTSRFAYVVRRGSVELLVDGRLHDLLGEGEMFAFASLLQDAPLGFVARAAEDTLAYRFPEQAILPVLERPAAVRYVVRSMARDVHLLTRTEEATVPSAGGRPVRELIRAPALVLPPDTGVQEAARRMVDQGATCVLVDLGDRLGIVTDRDLRTRVVADGAGPGTPISDVMSAPAWTVAADRSGTEALLEMLDHGIRHLPGPRPAGDPRGPRRRRPDGEANGARPFACARGSLAGQTRLRSPAAAAEFRRPPWSRCTTPMSPPPRSAERWPASTTRSCGA